MQNPPSMDEFKKDKEKTLMSKIVQGVAECAIQAYESSEEQHRAFINKIIAVHKTIKETELLNKQQGEEIKRFFPAAYLSRKVELQKTPDGEITRKYLPIDEAEENMLETEAYAMEKMMEYNQSCHLIYEMRTNRAERENNSEIFNVMKEPSTSTDEFKMNDVEKSLYEKFEINPINTEEQSWAFIKEILLLLDDGIFDPDEILKMVPSTKERSLDFERNYSDEEQQLIFTHLCKTILYEKAQVAEDKVTPPEAKQDYLAQYAAAKKLYGNRVT